LFEDDGSTFPVFPNSSSLEAFRAHILHGGIERGL
jgi:hypothetical protein